MKKMVIKHSQRRLPQRVAALSLALVLLYSQEQTAVAKEPVQRSIHECAYSLMNETSVRNIRPTAHEYVAGEQKNPDGTTSPVYERCVMYSIEKKGTPTCACGKTQDDVYWIVTTHSRCGRPREIQFE